MVRRFVARPRTGGKFASKDGVFEEGGLDVLTEGAGDLCVDFSGNLKLIVGGEDLSFATGDGSGCSARTGCESGEISSSESMVKAHG